MGLKKRDVVFMHSGLIGLGQQENGLDTITEAFQNVLSEGLLVIPSFTYSWCREKPFDPLTSECPNEVGAYSQNVWKDKRFTRSCDPNFSVGALKNHHNEKMITRIFDIGKSCFGKKSVFDHMYQLAQERDGYIMLLGGAHSDAIFRCTFIHYVEEMVGIPSRYLKKFYNPENHYEYVEQLVRYLSEEEYEKVNGKKNGRYTFPIKSDYTFLGKDLLENNLLTQKSFGYSQTRMVSMKTFCDFLRKQLRQMPDYCVSI